MSYDLFDIPDGIEPLIGYRGWLVKDDFTLTSCYKSDVLGNIEWPVGSPFRARCINPTFERASERGIDLPAPPKHYTFPLKDCTCGIYALSEYPNKWIEVEGERHLVSKPWPSDAIVGLVKGWGHMVLGTKGFRAEYAKPIALVTRPKSTRWSHIIEGVAEKYGLEVIDIREVRNGYR